MVHTGNESETTAALLREAIEDFARVRAMLERRYAREGRRLMRASDVHDDASLPLPRRAPPSADADSDDHTPGR